LIKALFFRRFWLIRHRLMTTVSFMVLLPLLLHIGITMVMKNIVGKSIDQIPYDIWVFPGIVLMIASVSTFSLIYRDFFNLRIQNHLYQSRSHLTAKRI